MSSLPLVTIVIPVFNGANYVALAIESALRQTYPDIEVLVVDDGSTDDGATRRAAESFGSRIQYLAKPNGGVATALNTGIEQMKGELFSWLSHDDLYRPDKIARQVEIWRNFDHRCVVIGDFELMDEQGCPYQRISLSRRNLIARPLDSVFRGLINGCALLVPRNLFNETGLFEAGLPTTQDYHLWYRMARIVPFVHCPHADVLQRIHHRQGSRHASHVDEASRMFAHLIDITPSRVMQAYDGSDLRFLLRTRQALSGYPGLKSYLTYRIEPLMRNVRYFVVLWGSSAPEPSSVARLSEMVPAPEDVLSVDASSCSVGCFEAPTCLADVVNYASDRQSGGIVMFAHASSPPTAEQVRTALEALITADADVARPANVPATRSELHGLVARKDALPALERALRESGRESNASLKHLDFTEYAAIDPFAVETPQDLKEALAGGSRILYHDGLSEAGIATVIAEGHNPRLPTILFVQHSRGGGAQVHMELLIRALAGKANAVIVYGESSGTLVLSLNPEDGAGGVVFRSPDQIPALVRILRHSGVERVDVHHTISFEEHANLLLQELRLPFDVTLVDYHLIAHSPFLCHDDGRFVGDEQLKPGAHILRRELPPVLTKAARVIAISRDLAERFSRLCPDVRVIPARLWHENEVRIRHVFPPALWGTEPLRIVIAGAIGPHKGRDIVIRVAQEIAARDLPLRLHIMGQIHLDPDEAADVRSAMTVHGRYLTGEFGSKLGTLAPHVAWVPAQVPETWSYVLSHFISAALPIAASALGAIPERCHCRSFTWLLPSTATASEWVELFLRLHATGLREPARWVSTDHLPPAEPFYFSEYLTPAVKKQDYRLS